MHEHDGFVEHSHEVRADHDGVDRKVPPPWGGGPAEDALQVRARLAATFGTSDVYPSQAAGYGTTTLMAMAGTLAERAEQVEETQVLSEQEPQVAATVAVTYAVLALTQAVRDLPEQLADLAWLAHPRGGTDG